MKAIFVSARSASTRLPNKALMKIGNKTTVGFLIDCLKYSKMADEIILCTTENKEDNALCEVATLHGVRYFRGSSDDKILRWHDAAKKHDVEFFVNVDGDDLLFDHRLADLCFKQYLDSQKSIDFIDGYGLYNDVYAVKFSALEQVCLEKQIDNTEFVRPLFLNNKALNIEKIKNVPQIFLKQNIRMTLDYQDDLLFFQNINNYFSSTSAPMTMENILDYLSENPEVIKINWHCENLWKINQKKSFNHTR
tara:strand:- start:5728 stop:6477 length:750 start_codon:yes stop_codon:yes gene_type:complete